jgi:hypothetical protein
MIEVANIANWHNIAKFAVGFNPWVSRPGEDGTPRQLSHLAGC